MYLKYCFAFAGFSIPPTIFLSKLPFVLPGLDLKQ